MYGPTTSVKAVTTARLIRHYDPEKNLKPEGVIFGSAWCSHQDQFSKEKGRKVALARALSHEPDRTWRGEVWDQYFAR